MSKSRQTFLLLFGAATLLVAIGALAWGISEVTHTGVHCGSVQMQPGDVCPHSSRRGHYELDYDEQRRDSHQDALMALGFGCTMLFAAGAFLLSPIYVPRLLARQAAAGAGSRPRQWRPQSTTAKILFVAFPVVVGSIWPVGSVLLGDSGWPLLLWIPVVSVGSFMMMRTYQRNGERDDTGNYRLISAPGPGMAPGAWPAPQGYPFPPPPAPGYPPVPAYPAPQGYPPPPGPRGYGPPAGYGPPGGYRPASGPPPQPGPPPNRMRPPQPPPYGRPAGPPPGYGPPPGPPPRR